MEEEKRMLKWLEKQKIKDQLEVENYKKNLIKNIRSIDKKELFPEPKKMSLWQKIKIMIFGT
jgi:hypothetical protein